jgi:hypothetical protein
MARAHAAQSRPADAEPILRQCLSAREKKEPDAWYTFNAKSMLGGALLGQKKYAEAAPLLLAGYKEMKKREKAISLPGQFRLREAADRLIELYTATNNPAELEMWRAERARYAEAERSTLPDKK